MRPAQLDDASTAGGEARPESIQRQRRTLHSRVASPWAGPRDPDALRSSRTPCRWITRAPSRGTFMGGRAGSRRVRPRPGRQQSEHRGGCRCTAQRGRTELPSLSLVNLGLSLTALRGACLNAHQIDGASIGSLTSSPASRSTSTRRSGLAVGRGRERANTEPDLPSPREGRARHAGQRSRPVGQSSRRSG